MNLYDAIMELKRIVQSMSASLSDLIATFTARTEAVEIVLEKPYRCRLCGQRYATSEEVRKCVMRHRYQSAKKYAKKARKAVPASLNGVRIAPRGREAALRSTEMRRMAKKG